MKISPAIELDELERDALTELVNIGVGNAAASLRDLIGHPVVLSVPTLSILTRKNAAQLVNQYETGKLVAVFQTFEGDLSGRALLVFPEANSLELVRAVVGDTLSLEDVIELEQEALAETGNIVLNGCLATVANMLHRSLKISLPAIVRGSSADFFALPTTRPDEDMVLFLYIHFSISERSIRGYIALLMDLPALVSLKALLGELILRTAGASPSLAHVPR